MSTETFESEDDFLANCEETTRNGEETLPPKEGPIDQFNDETFSAMEEWNPESHFTSTNEDSKKEDTKQPIEMMNLITSSINSLELDFPSDDRDLSIGPAESGTQQRTSQSSWGRQRHFEEFTPPSSNFGKTMNYAQDRRMELPMSQNSGIFTEERSSNSSRDFEDDLCRSDVYEQTRARYTAQHTATSNSSRRGSSNFTNGYYKDVRNASMSPQTFVRRNSSYRSENIDLRNAETFGLDYVERPHATNSPMKSQAFSTADDELGTAHQNPSYADDGPRCSEIRDPRVQDLYFETCRKLNMEPVFTQKERVHESISKLNEIKTTAFEHLKNIAELVPRIEVMEDIFDRLVDPEDPPCDQERLNLLDGLKHHVTPQTVLPFAKMVHARRLLMHSLAILSREKRYRDHALGILEEILRNLEKLLYEDRNDMVFGMKDHVFKRIINSCSMDEVLRLTHCLLTNNCDMAIESKLGLCFIGCLLETASNLDYRAYPMWIEKCLPEFRAHLGRIQRREVICKYVREPGLRHLLENSKINYSRSKLSYDSIRPPTSY